MGIRLQIVLSLAALLALAFLPLFFAVASLTQVAVRGMRESSARALVRGVSAMVEDGPARPQASDLAALLERHGAQWGVSALATFDAEGHVESVAGEGTLAGDLVRAVQQGAPHTLATRSGPAMAVSVPARAGTLAALVHVEEDSAKTAPLLRLLGFYTSLFAFALLTFAYIALTRQIVRPLEAISAAARRVAHGARALEAPERGPPELLDLGHSVSEMTATLLANERRMRDQIEELELRAQKLRDAQDRLVRSERLASVGKLSAGLAHEIGNPLAAILGLLDLLIAGDLTASEQHDFHLRVRAETERIHRVLRDLLDFARPGNALAGAEHQETPGQVPEAVSDVMALLQPQPGFREIALSIELASDLPAVRLRHEHITQVLLNLLLNAADACGPGGHVRLRAQRHDATVRIEVEDDGPGIDPAVRERLFEPFATTKDIGKGTGLGLAVCRGLIEAAQGTIVLAPRDDMGELPGDGLRALRGARFVVELPLAGKP